MEKIHEENLTESRVERSPEEVRGVFKQKYLLIDDGYDYTSESVPDNLPTLFHGTSAWFRENIEAEGLTNKLDSVEDIKKIFDLHPDLSRRFSDIERRGVQVKARMNPDKHSLRRRVYCTYSHEDAEIYGRGPEILREYIEVMERMNQDFYNETFRNAIPKIINDIQPIDTYEKKLLMSCLESKVLVAHVKATKEEFDEEGTVDYGGESLEAAFLSNSKSRKELISKIVQARDRYVEHARGNLVSRTEAEQMWGYVQETLNAGGLSEKEFEALSVADLVQIYLRSRSGYVMSSPGVEILFKKIAPGSIIKLEEKTF